MKTVNRLFVVLSSFVFFVTPVFADAGDGLYVRANETECNAINKKIPDRTLCLDASESILKLYNGSGWTRISINPGTETLFVAEPDSYLTIAGPYGFGLTQLRIGRGGVKGNNSLEATGEVSGPGNVSSIAMTATLTPGDHATPDNAGGDAYGLYIRPTVNISQYSTGPIGVNAHKYVAGQLLDIPRLHPLGSGAGKPQSLYGLWISDPLGHTTTVEEALLEAWALFVATTLGSKFSGAVQIGNPGTVAQPLVNGRGFGTRRNHMLWVTGTLKPSLDSPCPPARPGCPGVESYAAFAETQMITPSRPPDDRHLNIGTAHVHTPEITESGGAIVDTYTTLRVGNAPTDGGQGFSPETVRRALWVGTGQSEIEGSLNVGSQLKVGSQIEVGSGPTITSGSEWPTASAIDGSLYLRTGSGARLFVGENGAWVPK